MRVRHLADLDFDADFGVSSFKDAKPLEPDLEALWQDILWCEHFVLTHPLWWGGLPGRLKGLFDRILLPGMSFQYVKGKPLPEKLLKGRTAQVLVTSDTSGLVLHLDLWCRCQKADREADPRFLRSQAQRLPYVLADPRLERRGKAEDADAGRCPWSQGCLKRFASVTVDVQTAFVERPHVARERS